MELPLTRGCTLKVASANGTNDYGDAVLEYTEVETVCELQQRARAEDDENVSDTLWDLYLPAETDLSNIDRITVDGEGDFEILGDPWQARDPELARFSHVEATVRQTD